MILTALAGFSEAAQKLLVLQSLRVMPYEETLRGVRSVFSGKYKRLVLSEMEGIDLARIVREERPDVILAIGTEALVKVKKIKDTPIVYLMAPDPPDAISSAENITGVTMNISPEKQLSSFLNALPAIKRVGLLYNPAKTGSLAKKAQTAARAMGIELIAREVRNPKDVFTLTESMKGSIDAFWMLPDTTVVTPETVEFILLFSLKNKIPVLTFSEKYVEMGAFMALEIDPYELGKQGGETVRKILAGYPAQNIPRSEPRGTVLTINNKVAKKLGISLSNELLGRAKTMK